MSLDKIIVDLIGLGLIALVAWFFWFSKKEGLAVALTSAGVQEALIVVKGGYTPNVLVVKSGKPVRLKFNRQEASSCSEMVLFPDFDRSAHLPEGETVTVEFTPQKSGEYEFQCQMGMFRGKLLVED
jgi:plastocyanin domain-containing protein